MNNKIEVIARRILGWKLHSSAKWFDFENGVFVESFNPEHNINDAMLIVERFKKVGIDYSVDGNTVYFNEYCETGQSLAEAITNAAYSIAEVGTISDEWL